MTIDEVREQRGLEPLADGMGAQLYVAYNQVPLSTIANPATAPKPAPASADKPAVQQDGQDEVAPEGKKSLPKPRK
jgi:hypothetical protein